MPVLSPTLSSLWVGLVTPVPGASPGRSSSPCATTVVCHEHDIAAHVPDPPDGLIGFDEAVRLALRADPRRRRRHALVVASVAGVPSDPLPTDPDWAGGSLYVDERSARASTPRPRRCGG